MSKITVFYDHIRNACIQSGLSFEEIAAKLTSAGISGTEIDYLELVGDEGKQLADKLASVGLPVSSVYCHFRWELDTPAQNTTEVLSRLQSLNIHYLLAIPGFKKAGQSSEESISELIPPLKKLCEEAPKYDVHILMEDFDDSVAAFGTADQLCTFMEQIPTLECAFDTGNFFYFDEDALEAYDRLHTRITYVHCKDRNTTPVPGETGNATVSGVPMYSSAVGSGIIPMTNLIQNLLSQGYDGTFAIEHFGSPKQLEDMLTSAAYLNSLLH